jgi:hypothetical protein
MKDSKTLFSTPLKCSSGQNITSWALTVEKDSNQGPWKGVHRTLC